MVGLVVFMALLSGLAQGSSAAPPLRPGDAAPAIDASLLDEPSHGLTLDSLKGGVVVLDFWATWCAPCLQSFPHMNALVEQFKGRAVRFVSVTHEAAAIVRPVLEKFPLRTTVALDNGCRTFRAYQAWGLPRIALLGHDSRVASVIGPEALTGEVIEDLLAGKPLRLEQIPPWPDPKGAEEFMCGATARDP
ncbi:MAG TPA: TlpA disulfide reductase family protein [Vicinamibacteria bacterium]|nr:TlpA disulfide reductase family protein [Vicinamibacteria bacterium]